jgi:hypothetical protein
LARVEIENNKGGGQGQYFGTQSRMDMNIETTSTFPTDNSLGTDTAVERPRQQMRVKALLVIRAYARLLESPSNHSWLVLQAALDECVVSIRWVRQAGEDTSTASLPWHTPMLFPRFFCRF